jgi:hypothetical protein
MDWHDILIRCSALNMYLLITPVDDGKSIEMTLFDIKGRDKETQIFPCDVSPKALWQAADEWVTWHTLSEKRRRLRREARKKSIQHWTVRYQYPIMIISIVLVAAMFTTIAYWLFTHAAT